MGLCAALFLALLGITGTLMVFENEIDRALNPKLTWVGPGGHYLSLTEIQTRLERRYPGYTITGLAFSPRREIAWDAFLESKTSQRGMGIVFNPFTGHILGNEAQRNDFMNKVHQLHLRLLAGNAGASCERCGGVLAVSLHFRDSALVAAQSTGTELAKATQEAEFRSTPSARHLFVFFPDDFFRYRLGHSLGRTGNLHC